MASRCRPRPVKRAKGGDVGTVSKSELEPKLAKGVFSIPVGGLGLVHGEDGFYIVKVLSRGQADFPSVASEIKDQLKKTNQDAALKDWVETLKKKSLCRTPQTPGYRFRLHLNEPPPL